MCLDKACSRPRPAHAPNRPLGPTSHRHAPQSASLDISPSSRNTLDAIREGCRPINLCRLNSCVFLPAPRRPCWWRGEEARNAIKSHSQWHTEYSSVSCPAVSSIFDNKKLHPHAILMYPPLPPLVSTPSNRPFSLASFLRRTDAPAYLAHQDTLSTWHEARSRAISPQMPFCTRSHQSALLSGGMFQPPGFYVQN